MTRQLWDFDEVRLLRVKNILELIDVVEDVIDQVLQFLILNSLLLPILILGFFLESYVDKRQESEVHLWIRFKVSSLVLDELVKWNQLVLSCKDVLAIGLD